MAEVTNPRLLVFSDCNAREKMKDKKNDNVETWEPLSDDKSIGCGINSLTFLGIISKEIGKKIVKNIPKNVGTPFTFLMYYLMEISKRSTNLKEIRSDVSTLENTTKFLDALFNTLPDGCCVIATLNRNIGTLNHTIVFSKQKDDTGMDCLYKIDPQVGKLKKRIDDTTIFNTWERMNVVSVSLLFEDSLPSSIYSPKTYRNLTFNSLNKMDLLKKIVTDQQILDWKILDSETKITNKRDCFISVLSFFNVIEKSKAKIIANVLNQLVHPLANYIELISKYKPPKTIIIEQQYLSYDDLIFNLKQNLDDGYGTILLFVLNEIPTNINVGHAILCKYNQSSNTFLLFDPQSGDIFNRFEEYITYLTNNDFKIISIGLLYIISQDNSTIVNKKVNKKSSKNSSKKQNTIQINGYIENLKKRKTKKAANSFTVIKPNVESVPMDIQPLTLLSPKTSPVYSNSLHSSSESIPMDIDNYR